MHVMFTKWQMSAMKEEHFYVESKLDDVIDCLCLWLLEQDGDYEIQVTIVICNCAITCINQSEHIFTNIEQQHLIVY